MTARPVGDGDGKIPNWFGDILGDHTRPPVDGDGVWTPPATAGGRWARLNRSTGVYETWALPEPVGDGDGHDGLRGLGIILTGVLRSNGAFWDDAPELARALLPVVTAWAEQRARERAAEELRAAARDLDLHGCLDAPVPMLLQLRADALAADDRTGQPDISSYCADGHHAPSCGDCDCPCHGDDRAGQR